jgi:hypothetical protein
MKRDRQLFEQAETELTAARALLAATFHDENLRPQLVDRCRAAAEGYLRAFLTFRRIPYPETADLHALLELSDLGLFPSDVKPLIEYGDAHRALAAALKVKEAALEG